MRLWIVLSAIWLLFTGLFFLPVLRGLVLAPPPWPTCTLSQEALAPVRAELERRQGQFDFGTIRLRESNRQMTPTEARCLYDEAYLRANNLFAYLVTEREEARRAPGEVGFAAAFALTPPLVLLVALLAGRWVVRGFSGGRA